MSHPEIARFPQPNIPKKAADNNPDAAHQARQRIASLPNAYVQHAAPAKEDLVGAITPVSPAAQVATEGVVTPPSVSKEKKTAETVGVPDDEPSSPKKRRRLPSQLQPLIIGAVTFGLLFLLFKAPIFLSQLNYLTQPKSNVQTTQASTQVPPNPIVSIPKINVNAPIVFANSNVESAIQKDLESGIVHYADTAKPGENGNSVLFGHSSNDWWEPGNYKFVFVLLDKLQVGDTFSVNYNSHQYVYQVYETKVVEPTDLSVLNQTAGPEMTLITCTPPGTSWKRLVVKARQMGPAASSIKTEKAATTPVNQNQLPGNSPGITETLGNLWQSLVGGLSGNKPSQ